jgi:hypothetical protein
MQQPPLPPAPAVEKKQSKAWIWIVVAVIVGAVYLSQDTGSSSTSDSTTYEAPVITADMVVDEMPTATVTQFCSLYAQVDDYDFALNAFKRGYDVAHPSATTVFDELLSRC